VLSACGALAELGELRVFHGAAPSLIFLRFIMAPRSYEVKLLLGVMLFSDIGHSTSVLTFSGCIGFAECLKLIILL